MHANGCHPLPVGKTSGANWNYFVKSLYPMWTVHLQCHSPLVSLWWSWLVWSPLPMTCFHEPASPGLLRMPSRVAHAAAHRGVALLTHHTKKCLRSMLQGDLRKDSTKHKAGLPSNHVWTNDKGKGMVIGRQSISNIGRCTD